MTNLLEELETDFLSIRELIQEPFEDFMVDSITERCDKAIEKIAEAKKQLAKQEELF